MGSSNGNFSTDILPRLTGWSGSVWRCGTIWIKRKLSARFNPGQNVFKLLLTIVAIILSTNWVVENVFNNNKLDAKKCPLINGSSFVFVSRDVLAYLQGSHFDTSHRYKVIRSLQSHSLSRLSLGIYLGSCFTINASVPGLAKASSLLCWQGEKEDC